MELKRTLAEPSMHECVLTHDLERRTGVSTLDIATRLLDFGVQPPTIYFPRWWCTARRWLSRPRPRAAILSMSSCGRWGRFTPRRSQSRRRYSTSTAQPTALIRCRTDREKISRPLSSYNSRSLCAERSGFPALPGFASPKAGIPPVDVPAIRSRSSATGRPFFASMYSRIIVGMMPRGSLHRRLRES